MERNYKQPDVSRTLTLVFFNFLSIKNGYYFMAYLERSRQEDSKTVAIFKKFAIVTILWTFLVLGILADLILPDAIVFLRTFYVGISTRKKSS